MNPLGDLFINITLSSALQISILGFIGGILSGFIGSGGAFFMTPGMMNLGVMGPVAVASNITHKFGKAIVGSKKHGELGNVDKRLSIFMLITAALGIKLAVWAMTFMFSKEGGAKGAGANLYISLVFVIVLSVVSLSMLRDIIKSRKLKESGPSTKIVDFLSTLRLHPIIHFPVSDVKVSLWVVLICGLATGYLAGTIGVGGFIGVPAMIYVFGVPAAVAAGTELYLAIFMGVFGALNYAYEGLVDIRMVLLLYSGSLLGIHIGALGTKIVKEVVIRLVTSLIIIMCVLSRLIAIPMYLQQLGMIGMDPVYNDYLNTASKSLLYVSGIGGGLLILYFVFKSVIQRRKIQKSLSIGILNTAQRAA
ncbi:MAG: sulfite exporter TauE/SafE family protein [Desulfobacterales bacterium]|nr:sulfite exporter TauE/SafE family protein [Desulfobacterales bacterium]MBF0395814.1 sulfite exporter TauE/SafE family protein [Desulfobacterales bacterium]